MPPPKRDALARANLSAVPALAQDVFPRDALISWMREWSLPNKGSRRCVVFSLAREGALPSDDYQDLTHVEAPRLAAPESEREHALGTAADEIGRAAQALAGASGMRSTFFVRGHEAGKKLEDGTEEDPLRQMPRVTFPFSLTPPGGVRENYEGGELPTVAGVVGQMQRVTDTSLRHSQLTAGQVIDVLMQQSAQQQSWMVQMRQLQIQSDQLIQDLSDRKLDREIRYKNAMFDLALKEEAFEVVRTQVIPLIGAVIQSRYGIRLPSPQAKAAAAAAGADVTVTEVPQQDPLALVAYIKGLGLKPRQLGALVCTLSRAQLDVLNPMLYTLAGEMTPEERKEFDDMLSAEAERRKNEGEP